MLVRLATRATTLRVAPTMVRFYPGGSEGATATSKGFGTREQAEEGQYIHRKEQERLKAAREKLKAAQAEVDAAEQSASEASNKK